MNEEIFRSSLSQCLRERRAAASVGVEIGGGMGAEQAASASPKTGSRGDGAGRMAGAIEKKKAALVGKAAVLAAEMLDPAERATAERVIGEFYEHVPPADVVGRSARDLCGAALALWHFAERRRPGQAKIRVYNPDA